MNVHDLLRVVEVENRLTELEQAGIDNQIIEIIATRPTAEEQIATLQEWDAAVFWIQHCSRIEASMRGEVHSSNQNSSDPTRPSTEGIP